MDGYWIWCPSIIQDEQGLYHMFASRWPDWLPMHPGWLTNSEVVRATASRPEGPYQFAEVVLPARGPEYWDGRSTHNPTVRFHAGRYYLFYTGITFPLKGLQQGDSLSTSDPHCIVARASKRVGLAWADSPDGPWHRMDQPLLPTSPDTFYSFLTSNPAPTIHADGRVTMLFKARSYVRESRLAAYRGDTHGAMTIGIATADRPEGPYRVACAEPLFSPDRFGEIEDPFLWEDGDGFHLIAKDMSGVICGETGAGIYARSPDAQSWALGDPRLAYSLRLPLTGGGTQTVGSLERPFLFRSHGRITHLCASVSNGTTNFADATRTWNVVIPINESPLEY